MAIVVVSVVVVLAIAMVGIAARGEDLGTNAPAERDGLLPVFVFAGEDFAEGVGHGFDDVVRLIAIYASYIYLFHYLPINAIGNRVFNMKRCIIDVELMIA